MSKSNNSKSLGVKGSKALKHHYPSTSLSSSSPKIQLVIDGGSSLGTKFDSLNGVGNLVQGQGFGSQRRSHSPNSSSSDRHTGVVRGGVKQGVEATFSDQPNKHQTE